LEELIGGRWYAFVGALVVVAGVAMFFKWAYDQGWFHAPPEAKCLGGVAFGVLLLVAGEVVRRRLTRFAAIGLNAAGVGVIYCSVYAAYGYFELIGVASAFALLAGTAALGIAVASYANMPVVAVVSLIGGYLTPVLLHRAEAKPWVLPAYLLALLVVGLVLAAWKRGAFAVVRSVAWWGTVLFGTGWVLAVGARDPWLGLPFLGAVWALVHAELVAEVHRTAPDEHQARSLPQDWLYWRPMLASFSSTGWAAMLGVIVVRTTPVLPEWFIPGAALVPAAVASLMLAGHLRVLRDAPRSPAERLGASLATQAGGLLIATIALGLSGWLQVAGWLAVGVAAVAAARWTAARALAVYGLIVLAIGTGRLLFWDSWAPGTAASMTAGGEEIFGLVLTRWSLLVAIAGASWLASAGLVHARWTTGDLTPMARPRGVALLATGAGLAVLFASVLHTRAEPASIAVVWLAGSVTVLAMRFVIRGLWLDRFGAVGLAAATGAWALAYLVPGWSGSTAPVGAHPGLWLGIAIAAAFAAAGSWLLARPADSPAAATQRTLVQVAWLAAGVLVFTATSCEVARGAGQLAHDPTARKAAVSIWWGLFGVAMITLGFLRHLPVTRHVGLALLGVATAKALVFDLIGVSQGWRILSFLGLGMLMLGVAVLYAKVSAALASARAEAEAEARPDAEGGTGGAAGPVV
jgi:uncharacterized membrane protein